MNKTPIKKYDIQQKQQSKNKMSQSNKKKNQQFNPRLYVTPTISEADVLLLKQAFQYHDSNGTGVLTPNDLKLALFHEGFHATKQTVYNIIAEYDEQCLGGLTFGAFMRIISSNPVQNESPSQLRKVFRKYDKDNKGYINQVDFQQIAKSLKQNMTNQQISEMFNCMDKNKNGKVDFDRFCQIMHHSNSIY